MDKSNGQCSVDLSGLTDRMIYNGVKALVQCTESELGDYSEELMTGYKNDVRRVYAAILATKAAEAVQPAANDPVLATWPERIYLQWNPDEREVYPGLSEDLTWCSHSIHKSDVEYVRADLALASAPQAESEAPAILEAISWHAGERDDLTLEEAVESFRHGYKKVRQRSDRAMLLQLIDLMASAPVTAGAPQADEQSSMAGAAKGGATCVCGSPSELGTVHRQDGPCYAAPVAQECEQQSYAEADGCPTERAVLQRFWREHQSTQPTPSDSGSVDTPELRQKLWAFKEAGSTAAWSGTTSHANKIIAHIESLIAARVAALKEEIAIDDKLLAERNRVLQAISECEVHGDQCIPHALEWIAGVRKDAERMDWLEANRATLTRKFDDSAYILSIEGKAVRIGASARFAIDAAKASHSPATSSKS